MSSYFYVPGGDFDGWSQSIERVLNLVRLGSDSTQRDCDSEEVGRGCGTGGANQTEDQDFIYIFTPPAQASGSGLVLLIIFRKC